MDIHKKKEELFLESYEYDCATSPRRAREVTEEIKAFKKDNDNKSPLDLAMESVIDALISGKYDKRSRSFKED